MATVKPEVKKILEQFGLNPRDALWDCHGTWVLLHKACQTIQHKLNIQFDEPKILHMDMDKKTVVIQVKATVLTNDASGPVRYEIGEAAPANNKNAYPVAMAIKRAEDKAIIHLAKLREHGVYSSEEADDFKAKPVNGNQKEFADKIRILIKEATNPSQVKEIVKGFRPELRDLPVAEKNRIKKLHDDKITEMKGQEQ
jgi:hypothetical protein